MEPDNKLIEPDDSWDDDYDDDDDSWQPCDDCDLPDACADFGCAIKKGLRTPKEW